MMPCWVEVVKKKAVCIPGPPYTQAYQIVCLDFLGSKMETHWTWQRREPSGSDRSSGASQFEDTGGPCDLLPRMTVLFPQANEATPPMASSIASSSWSPMSPMPRSNRAGSLQVIQEYCAEWVGLWTLWSSLPKLSKGATHHAQVGSTFEQGEHISHLGIVWRNRSQLYFKKELWRSNLWFHAQGLEEWQVVQAGLQFSSGGLRVRESRFICWKCLLITAILSNKGNRLVRKLSTPEHSCQLGMLARLYCNV